MSRRLPAGMRRPMVASILMALFLAGCGSSAGSGAQNHGSGGPVSVLYAGSLVNLMERDLGPAFARAKSYGYEGFGAGSTELVAQIKSGIRQGSVFISASPKADGDLEGSRNGQRISWYIVFARAPLVLGYNPHSRFAAQFRHRPWYQVVTQPGIRIGRTDPLLDPKGKLTVEAVDEAAQRLRRPKLTQALSGFQVFPEESLVGRLEAGQLDAGFFYSNEALEQHIPTVALTPVSSNATYTVTILRGAPNPAGAAAFIAFLLGPTGQSMLRRHGLTALSPQLVGSPAAVPSRVRALLPG